MRSRILLLTCVTILLGGCHRPSQTGGLQNPDSQPAPAPAGPQTLAAAPYRPLPSLAPAAGTWERPDPSVARLSTPIIGEDLFEMDPARWGQMLHKVRPGETLGGISQKFYGKSNFWPQIQAQNAELLKTTPSLQAGQWLYLPAKPLRDNKGQLRSPKARPDSYIFARGDTLAQVARIFLGDSKAAPRLAQFNRDRLRNPNKPQPGTIIRIPQK